MTLDFYTVATLERLFCLVCLTVIFIKRSQGPMLRAQACVYAAWGASLVVFFVRPFTPVEWQPLLRDIGAGVQGLALGTLLMLIWRRKI